MALKNFTNLDFDQIKDSLKDYLKNNSNFTDYDFDGSNLSSILDVLAYNTYITSYNANMISNEVFIDSATLRENVVALARNIGYVPRSKKSSRALVTFFVDISSVSPSPANLTLKKGPVASTGNQFGGQSFVFGIPEDKTVSVIDGIASFDDIEVYEGSLLDQTFTYSSRNPFQKFILPNSGIDLDSLVVTVRPSIDSSVSVTYSRQDNLFDSDTGSVISGTSNIYFIQEVESERYEIIFGDGVFGKQLQDGNIIEVSYITTNGSDGNGVSNFTFSGSISYVRNSVEIFVTEGISLITTPLPSSGGESIESVDSIRKFAPQVYATQNRALSASDYETLIPNKIYPETESISVFGGEDLVPPQYGKVFVRSVRPRPSVGSRSLGWVLCGPMCKSADLEGGLSNPAKAASNRRRTSEISRCAPSDMFFYEIVPTLVTANKRRLEPTDIEIDHDTAVDQYELFAESCIPGIETTDYVNIFEEQGVVGRGDFGAPARVRRDAPAGRARVRAERYSLLCNNRRFRQIPIGILSAACPHRYSR